MCKYHGPIIEKGQWTNTWPPIHNYKYTHCKSSVHLSKQGASLENGHNSAKGVQALISTAWIPRECNVLQCLLTILQTIVFYRPLDSSSSSVLLMMRSLWPVKLILNTYGAFLGTRVFAPFYPLVLPVITGCLRAKSVPEMHYYRHGFPFLTPDSNQRVISRFLKSLRSWYWVDEMNFKICKQIKDVISFH